MNDLVNEMVCGSIIEKLCCFLEGKYIMFNYKWCVEDEFWGGQGSTNELSVTHTTLSTFDNKL